MNVLPSKALALSTLLCTLFLGLLHPGTSDAAGIQVMIDGKATVFTDVQSTIWFATYVQQAAEAGIVNGYKDARGNLTGRFGPSNSITIAEALKIAVEGAGYDAELYGSLVDSGMKFHWATAYISVAKAEGFAIVPDRMRIDRNATRAEVAALITSAFSPDLTNASPVDTRYTDVKASTPYAASIEVLSRDGILSGDTDAHGNVRGTFRPLEAINRAEVVKMIILARARYNEPGASKKPTEQEANHVSFTSTGFTPNVLRVKAGTTVTFKNDDFAGLWVASNPHPLHTSLAGFDSNGSLKQGEIYTYTFTRLGTWGYHNHLTPSVGGTIIVE